MVGLAKNGFEDTEPVASYYNTLKWNCLTITGRLEAVIANPAPPRSLIRDTAVVVRQMILNTERSICICGFAVYQSKVTFAALAKIANEHKPLLVRVRPIGSVTQMTHQGPECVDLTVDITHDVERAVEQGLD